MEWLNKLMVEFLSPERGLFSKSPNEICYQPNEFAKLIPNYRTIYRIIGRIIAKCLIDELRINLDFTKPFLKHILSIYFMKKKINYLYIF